MALFFATFHFANTLAFLGLVVTLFGFPAIFALPYAAKTVVDALLFFRSARIFRQWSYAPTFLLWEITYIFYNAIIGPLSLFAKIEWKVEETS